MHFKSLYFSWSSRDCVSWKIYKLEKTSSYVLKNTLSRHYNLLIVKIFWNFMQGLKATFKTQEFILIHTEVIIYFNVRTKFSLRLTFNRQKV